MAGRAKGKKWNDPVHPGEILADELEFIGMTAAEMAKRIGVPKNRLYQIVAAKRAMTADTALRVGKFFGGGPDLWLDMQKRHDTQMAERKIGKALRRIEPYKPGA